MSCCFLRRTETPCPPPPVNDPGGGTVTTPTASGLWFECAVPGGGCHHGIGFVRFYNGTGNLLYAGCPATTGTTRVYVSFDPSQLNHGARLHVDYVHERTTLRGGLTSPCAGGHYCNRGIFRAGLGDKLIGTANINNQSGSGGPFASNDGGAGYDRYNVFYLTNDTVDSYLAGLAATPGTPTTPGGLAATYMNQTRIVLVWNDLSVSETGYQVERRIGGGAYSLIATTPANTAIYVDETPPGGAFGYDIVVSYRVREVQGSTFGPWAVSSLTTPPAPDPSRRQVCYIEYNMCTGWTEAIRNATASVNYVPVGYKIASLPAFKTFRIALINYASLGVANTSRGALLNVTDGGIVLATYALSLQSNNSPLSPFPFDGQSIDGVPFSITNIWGRTVDIEAAGGVPGFPGIYFDDSAAYQIV
jgi:hypothetical protein